MEQESSKTPCRTVGLRRLTSASKKAALTASPATPSGLNTKDVKRTTRVGLFLTDGNNSVPSPQPISEPPVVAAKSSALPNPVSSTPKGKFLHKRKSDTEFNYPSGSPCTSRITTNEDCQGRNCKIPKLDILETFTVEDLHALQKMVGLKERRLKELRQAEVIRKKHNPDLLRKDIKIWLQACQSALQELLAALQSRGGNVDMCKLLSELSISSTLVHYNEDTDEFE